MPSKVRVVRTLGLLWVIAALGCTLLGHGLRAEYLPIEAATAGVWVVVLGAAVSVATWLVGRGSPAGAIMALILGGLLACDVAVIVDSALIYDVAGYWRLDGGAGLPYRYAPLWFPAALTPGATVFGIDQAAISAGDFEWQAEHVVPVAFTLSIMTLVFIAPWLLRLRRHRSDAVTGCGAATYREAGPTTIL